jgi:hypothetical protein
VPELVRGTQAKSKARIKDQGVRVPFQWLVPIIQATQEIKIRKFKVQGQPQAKS